MTVEVEGQANTSTTGFFKPTKKGNRTRQYMLNELRRVQRENEEPAKEIRRQKISAENEKGQLVTTDGRRNRGYSAASGFGRLQKSVSFDHSRKTRFPMLRLGVNIAICVRQSRSILNLQSLRGIFRPSQSAGFLKTSFNF